jgi:hypothetical protein
MFGMNISVADLGGGYRLGSGEGLFKIDGIAELIRKFNAMKVNTKRIVMAGLREEMEGILQLAVDKYVPIDSGQLRDSKHMRGSFEGDTVMVEGGFGPVFNERGSGYAVPVHEIPEPPSKSPGGRSAYHEFGSWKYLQIPFLERAGGMEARLQAHLIGELEGKMASGIASAADGGFGLGGGGLESFSVF